MTRECVFKMFFNGEWWYVYRVSLSGVDAAKVYRVYKGRRWLNHIAFYHPRFAIEAILGCAFGGFVQLNDCIKL